MSLDKIPPVLLSTFCLCLHALLLARRTRFRYCQVGSSFQMSQVSYSGPECPHMEGGLERERERERERLNENECMPGGKGKRYKREKRRDMQPRAKKELERVEGAGVREAGRDWSERLRRGWGKRCGFWGQSWSSFLPGLLPSQLLEHLHPGGGVSKWSCLFPGLLLYTFACLPSYAHAKVLAFPLTNQPLMPKQLNQLWTWPMG